MTDDDRPGRDVRFGGRTVFVRAAFRTDMAEDALRAIQQAAQGPKNRMAMVASRVAEPHEIAAIPCFHAQPHPVVGAIAMVNTDEPEHKVANRIRKMLQMHACTARLEYGTVVEFAVWAELAAAADKAGS